MKDVYMFIPEPKNNKAIVAVSAIACAMKEMNKCAILRCVWRQGQGNVVIGVLTPNISSMDNIVSPSSSSVITSNYFVDTVIIFIDFVMNKYISGYRIFFYFWVSSLLFFMNQEEAPQNKKRRREIVVEPG
jgi:Ku70/Ku80 beta-barrel domain